MIQRHASQPVSSSPRLLALSMIKNEIDVVELFVRHNLQFLDAMLIIDNGSTDGTRELLARLLGEGLPLVIYDDPRPANRQAERMTALYTNNLCLFAPDYVFLLDADEFLRVESREILIEHLSEIPPGHYGTIPWQTYVLGAGTIDDEEPLFARIVQRRRREVPHYSKAALPWHSFVESDLEIRQGNHEVFQSGGKHVPHVPLRNISLAHFPVRSFDQLRAKTIIGWLAQLTLNPQAPSTGYGTSWHQRELYKLMVAGELTPDTLARVSANFAQTRPLLTEFNEADLVTDPVITGAETRYGRVAKCDSLIAIARFTEAVIAELGAEQSARNREFAGIGERGKLRHRLRELHARTLGKVKPAGWMRRRDPTEVDGTGSAAAGLRSRGDSSLLDVPPFRYLWDKYRPESVLDLGCGLGGYVAKFGQWGAKQLQGVDQLEFDERILCRDAYRMHDLREPLRLGSTFDLVVCVEVIEHLDSSHETTLLETICRHARDRILFAAAGPGQPGRGHVNCRPLAYWLVLWESFGFLPDAMDTLAFRSLATLSWLRRNPVVLVRQGACKIDTTFGRFDLDRLAAHPKVWPDRELQTSEIPSSVRLIIPERWR